MDEFPSYREQIRSAFQKRHEANKNYSLRAFARDLQLDPGQLSSVLNGKKNISLSKASELSKKLFQNPREMLIFFHSVEYDLATTDESKNELLGKITKIRESHSHRNSNISEDEFEIISNWYNLPMLELAGIKEFKVDADSAAKYFGISKAEAAAGLQVLSRLGFAKKAGDYFERVKPVVTTTEIPSFGIRVFHQQMIKKAIEALFGQSIKKRYFSGATLSFPSDKIDEVKKMVDDHEKKLVELAESYRNEPNQVVYQINSQLISLKAEDYD